MTEDGITPAKDRIDAFRDMQQRFHNSWIVTERAHMPIQTSWSRSRLKTRRRITR